MTLNGKTLTPREETIAVLVAEGRLNKDVASALNLTEAGMKVRLSRLYYKLGIDLYHANPRISLMRLVLQEQASTPVMRLQELAQQAEQF